jgi:hypothetical protein
VRRDFAAFVFAGSAKRENDPHKVPHKVQFSEAAKRTE